MEFWLESLSVFVRQTTDENPKAENYLLHSHTTCELFYLKDGSGSFSVEGNRYPLAPGDLLLMRESERHSFNPEEGIPCSYIAVQYAPALLPASGQREAIDTLLYKRNAGERNQHRPPDSSRDFILACLTRLCQDSNLPANDQVLLYLLPILQELSVCRSWQTGTPENLLDAEERALLRRIMAYIDQHLEEISGLESLEKEFYFPASRINRLFRTATEESTWQYILRKRLSRVRDKMREGENAATAAAACGFGDYSSFYRLFKKNFGVSPAACKKNR